MNIFNKLALIVPPHPDDYAGETDEEREKRFQIGVRRWRWKMFYAVSGVWVMVLAMMAASFGVFPAVYQGFASAEDQQTTQGQVTAVRVEQLEAQLFNLRKDQCAALKEGRSGGAYWQQMQVLIDTLYALTKKVYIPIPCNEL